MEYLAFFIALLDFEIFCTLAKPSLRTAKGRMRVLSLFSRCVLGVKWLFTEITMLLLQQMAKLNLENQLLRPYLEGAERFTCTSHAARSLFTVYNAERK